MIFLPVVIFPENSVSILSLSLFKSKIKTSCSLSTLNRISRFGQEQNGFGYSDSKFDCSEAISLEIQETPPKSMTSKIVK